MSRLVNIVVLGALFALFFPTFALAVEELVITTYYPSPAGSYLVLDVTNRLTLNGIRFATNDASYNYIWSRGTAFQVVNDTGATGLATIFNNGGLVVGSPTGGNMGLGTVNATAVYDDSNLLTDYVFDKYFDGKVRDEDLEKHGNYEMKKLEQMIAYIEKERHLPTMIGRKEWEAEGPVSLGKIVTQLWETVETQAIYIKELKEEISVLREELVKLKGD